MDVLRISKLIRTVGSSSTSFYHTLHHRQDGTYLLLSFPLKCLSASEVEEDVKKILRKRSKGKQNRKAPQ